MKNFVNKLNYWDIMGLFMLVISALWLFILAYAYEAGCMDIKGIIQCWEWQFELALGAIVLNAVQLGVY